MITFLIINAKIISKVIVFIIFLLFIIHIIIYYKNYATRPLIVKRWGWILTSIIGIFSIIYLSLRFVGEFKDNKIDNIKHLVKKVFKEIL